MLVSVFSPTMRGLFALRPIEQSLKGQTFTSFEWLVEIGDGKTHDLNAAFNRMLRRARGELVVFAEDFLWFPTDGIEKFVKAYRGETPGVPGGQFLTAPVPKARGYWEGPGGLLHYKTPVEPEWRGQHSAPTEIDWRYWEIDWGAAPLSKLKECGGFDEALDVGWGNDNSNLGYRASLMGARFYCLPIESVSLKHDEFFAHPFRERYDPVFAERRRLQFENGEARLEPIG